jgi:2-isopropylmalate synthase
MNRRIKIFDTTLRDGEQTPGASLNIDEKLQIAHQLEKLRVDVIEGGFAIASEGDAEALRRISEEVRECTVASLARSRTKDIDAAYEAIKGAASPRIHVFLASSDIHLQYKLKITREQMLEQSVEAVKYAKKYVDNVQFSAEDAGRTDREFLAQVVRAVINAGATTVNIPDTVGYNTPEEFGALIAYLFEHVDNINKADIAVHCHNDLGLAVANSLAAAVNGATQLECTVNGLGERAGNASLEEIVMGLKTRRDYYGLDCGIDTTQIYRSSRLVSALSGVKVQRNKAIVGENAFAHESGIHQHGMLSNMQTYEIMTPEVVGVPKSSMTLGKLSGRHAFAERLHQLGFELTDEALDEAFKRFKRLADRKKDITDADIEALIFEDVSAAEEAYELKTFQIFGANDAISTGTICLKSNGHELLDCSTGNGPIDAAFNCINRIIGKDFALDQYYIKAVTGGKDALGEVTVTISLNGRQMRGHGVSTDIIEASIRAYLNAVNKF